MGAVPQEALLEAHDLQGDILSGFRKDYETFLFLRIEDPTAAKDRLRSLLPRISPLVDVAAFNELFRSVRSRRGEIRGTLTATWANIGFTAEGLSKLTSIREVGRFQDRSFRLGLARRSSFLGDPISATMEGNQRNWLFGGASTPVDTVVLIASDEPDRRNAATEEFEGLLTTSAGGGEAGFTVIWREDCETRHDLPGHEHFGFKDGIAQPGIRGRLTEADYLTRRDVEINPADPRTLCFSRPGQPLVWPGQFILGLERQRASLDDASPLPPVPVTPGWARNGSFLVIRRLRQDVQAFEAFVDSATEGLLQTTGFEGLTAEHLAAMLVGRWPSGAPLIRAPEQDDPALGQSSGPNNAFGYLNAEPPLPLRSGAPSDPFALALPDPDGRVCPHGAHVRKMNPRDQPTVRGPAGSSLQHLILRRGLPFDRTAAGEGVDPADKGLMFACYQSSLRQGFEFLTAQWANSPSQPLRDPGGEDLIIGQGPSISSGRRRRIHLWDRNGVLREIVTQLEWVIPTGGGYFFSPSISALRDVLAR